MADDPKLTACRAWLVEVLPELVDVVILRSPYADAPRPVAVGGAVFPYAAIGWIADVPVGATPYEVTSDEPAPAPNDDEFLQKRQQRRRRTLQIRIYGDEPIWDMSTLIRSTLRRQSIRQLFNDAGLRLWPLGEPVDASEFRDNAWEWIVLLDFGVWYMVDDSNPIPVIETVEIEFNGETYPVLGTPPP